MTEDQTRKVIQQELGGAPLSDVFEWIDLKNVLGSASIAQVVASAWTSPVVRSPLDSFSLSIGDWAAPLKLSCPCSPASSQLMQLKLRRCSKTKSGLAALSLV